MSRRIGFPAWASPALGLILLSWTSASRADDRAYQHGIDFLQMPGGKICMIWASAGNPPTEPGGSWTHDIFYSWVTPGDPAFVPVKLISETEAQEPASSAVSADGKVFVTMEDGYDASNEVAQRYGVYDAALKPIRAYPQLILDGGHSGHVAASGNRFVVFYSEGWVDGGGVDNLGSGDDVYASIHASSGTAERTVDVAVGSSTRDWWPVVAGSADRACLVWQRFVNGQTYADLMVSLVDPATGTKVLDQKKLTSNVKYYTYAVEYLPSLDRFLVLATLQSGGGVAYLLDPSGAIKAENQSLPATVREAELVVQATADAAYVAAVRSPSGVMILKVGAASIELSKQLADTYTWGEIGTDGIFFGQGDLQLGSLSTKGLIVRIFRKAIELPANPGGGTNPSVNPPSGSAPGTSDGASSGTQGGSPDSAASTTVQENPQGSASPSGTSDAAANPAGSPGENAVGCGCGPGVAPAASDGLLGCLLLLLLLLPRARSNR